MVEGEQLPVVKAFNKLQGGLPVISLPVQQNICTAFLFEIQLTHNIFYHNNSSLRSPRFIGTSSVSKMHMKPPNAEFMETPRLAIQKEPGKELGGVLIQV